MKSIILVLTAAFLATQITRAQQTTYLSNLGQTPTGVEGVGSNFWWAASFKTGANTGGYLLDSFQLSMANESSAGGTPAGFTVGLYNTEMTGQGGIFYIPENNLVTLDGSANPSTAGIYTYTPPSDFTLSPDSFYSMVVTANTPYIGPQAASEGYEIPDTTTFAYGPIDGWSAWNTSFSRNGVNWFDGLGGFFIYSITAEPVPEPGTLGLSLSGTLFFIRRYWKTA